MNTKNYDTAPVMTTSVRLDGTPRSADTVLHNAEQIEKLAVEFVQRLESISQFIRPTPEDNCAGNPARPAGVMATLEGAASDLSRGLAILGEIDRKLGL